MGPSDEISKNMRRQLRKKLKEELIKVQGLSSKLEARAMQLLQSHSLPLLPSFSDAQFSGNDVFVRGGSSKEVTSQLNLAANGSIHQVAPLSKQPSLGAGNGSLVGAELIGSKRTPKVSQVYKKSEFLVGKDKLPSPMKSNARLSKSNGQSTRMLNERKLPRLPNASKTLCANILRKLMDHEDGWIFNEPVDAIKLGLSDYHSIIKRPMDLGTIKRKLEKRQYRSVSDFADDVKLTFNNAMSYNPPGNDVHQSARTLLTIFQREWDVLKEKLSKRIGPGELNVLGNSICQGPESTKAGSEANPLRMNKVALLATKSLQSQSSSVPARHTAPGRPKVPLTKSKPSLKPDMKKTIKDASILETPLNQEGASGSLPDKIKPHSMTKSSTSFQVAAKTKAPRRPIKSVEKEKSMERPSGPTKAKASLPKRVMTYEEKVRLQSLLGQLPQHKLEELIYLIRERNVNVSQEGDEIEVDLDSFDDDTLWELHNRASDCLRNLQKGTESRKRPREANNAEETDRRRKGPPTVSLEQNGASGNRSSSESGSSTDSDCGSSSTSDSDG